MPPHGFVQGRGEAMSEVGRFEQFFRMLGHELEPFQRQIVEEIFSPAGDARIDPARLRQVDTPGRCGAVVAAS